MRPHRHTTLAYTACLLALLASQQGQYGGQQGQYGGQQGQYGGYGAAGGYGGYGGYSQAPPAAAPAVVQGRVQANVVPKPGDWVCSAVSGSLASPSCVPPTKPASALLSSSGSAKLVHFCAFPSSPSSVAPPSPPPLPGQHWPAA